VVVCCAGCGGRGWPGSRADNANDCGSTRQPRVQTLWRNRECASIFPLLAQARAACLSGRLRAFLCLAATLHASIQRPLLDVPWPGTHRSPFMQCVPAVNVASRVRFASWRASFLNQSVFERLHGVCRTRRVFTSHAPPPIVCSGVCVCVFLCVRACVWPQNCRCHVTLRLRLQPSIRNSLALNFCNYVMNIWGHARVHLSQSIACFRW
jgi:hypothetical protein